MSDFNFTSEDLNLISYYLRGIFEEAGAVEMKEIQLIVFLANMLAKATGF